MRVPAATIVLLALAAPVAAQSSSGLEDGAPVVAPAVPDDQTVESVGEAAGDAKPEPFLQALKQDFSTFFTSSDTARTMVVFGTGALSVSRWDAPAARSAHAHWSDEAFGAGKVAGGFYTQMALAGGTYFAGRLSGRSRVERLGSRLLRAQIVSQSVIQATKFATGRSRPDGSNSQSLPSGHTASAFATAAVVHRELGWKAGVPAYAFAAWVGASRMEANKHYMSDVLLGAGVGIAAAHSVTLRVGHQKLALGVESTPGGAAVTLSPF
jgi:membrane-associated phospholipid phosphatase